MNVPPNLKGLYDGIMKACGPAEHKTAQFKAKDGTLLADKHDQMRRWKVHYTDLYSTESELSNHVRANIPQWPIVTSLDDSLSLEELSTALNTLPSGKASSQYGIPAELIRRCKTVLLPSIYRLIVRCWDDGTMPQDFKNSKIVTLYKNKGDRSDCNNHRSISLLSVVGKLFARVVLRRLQVLPEAVHPESKCWLEEKG